MRTDQHYVILLVNQSLSFKDNEDIIKNSLPCDNENHSLDIHIKVIWVVKDVTGLKVNKYT